MFKTMDFIGNIKKDFKDMPYLKSMKRAFDKLPIQCSMYITDRCNLSCQYCSEFDNSKPHPNLNVIKKRIDNVVKLGILKLTLAGGEPLLHPDIEEIIRYSKSKGITVSISTNSFLLTDSMINKLTKAALDVIQISVDRKTPSQITQKSLDKIAPKIEKLKKTDIKIHISGVICEDTMDEIEDVLRYGLKQAIPTELRLMHGDQSEKMKIHYVTQKRGIELIEMQMKLKKRGLNIHATNKIMAFQRDKLKGKEIEWTCLAGYKIFFVSSEGYFWPCSLLKSRRKIEEIKLEDLVQYNYKKDCQSSCGIYCAISNSMFVQNPIRFVAAEIPSKIKQNFRLFFAKRYSEERLLGY